VGSPELDPALQMCLLSVGQRGSITSLNLLATLLLTQPRRLSVFAAARALG